MTIENGNLSKQLVLYPHPQPSMEHDLLLWLKGVEEDMVYSSPICTLDTTIGEVQLDEDDLIEKILHNQPPNTMFVEDLVKKYEDNPWTNFFLVDLSPTNVKMI